MFIVILFRCTRDQGIGRSGEGAGDTATHNSIWSEFGGATGQAPTTRQVTRTDDEGKKSSFFVSYYLLLFNLIMVLFSSLLHLYLYPESISQVDGKMTRHSYGGEMSPTGWPDELMAFSERIGSSSLISVFVIHLNRMNDKVEWKTQSYQRHENAPKVLRGRNWTFSKVESNLGDWYFQHDSLLHRMGYYHPSLESFAMPRVCSSTFSPSNSKDYYTNWVWASIRGRWNEDP